MVLGQKEPTSKFLQAMTKEMGVDLVREEAAVAATPGIPAVPREKVKYVLLRFMTDISGTFAYITFWALQVSR